MTFSYKFLIVLASYFVAVLSIETCVLDLKIGSRTPTFPPFVLTPEKKFYPTSTDDTVILQSGAEAIVTCQNQNLKNFDRKQLITVSCKDGKLNYKGEEVSFSKLTCDLRIIEEVQHGIEKCNESKEGQRGVIYLYFDSDKETYMKLAEVCYDYKMDRNIFVRTYTKFPSPQSQLMDRKAIISNTNITHRISILNIYRVDKIDKQISKVITKVSDYLHCIFDMQAVKVMPKLFFNRQLSDVEKFPTNTAALWTMVSQGNWKRVQNDIQKFVDNHKDSLELIIGTDGVLSSNGKEVFLNGDTVPVPLFIWAVVYDKKTHKGVAVTTMNDPFAKSIPSDKMAGQNLCDKMPWLRELLKDDNYQRIAFGYTHCTSLDKFKPYTVDEKSVYNENSLLK